MVNLKFTNLRAFLLMVAFLGAIALTPLISTAQTPAPRPCFDFTGTGRTSFATTTGNFSGPLIDWHILSNGGDGSTQTVRFGRGYFEPLFRDDAVPGYYDGDNRADIAVARSDNTGMNGPNTYYIRPSTSADSNPSAYYGVSWGTDEDFPVTGDYDGDGRDDITIIRNDSGYIHWWILRSGSNTYNVIRFGLWASDRVVSGADYNGDGRDELTVIRFSNSNPRGSSTYFAGDSNTGAMVLAQDWGDGGGQDVYVIGDYLGDRRADFAVMRLGISGVGAPNATWYIQENGGKGQIVTRVFGYGNANPVFPDFAVCGDYNGDGKQDIAVYRYPDRTFYWLNSPDFNSFSYRTWGKESEINYPIGNLHTLWHAN